MKHLISRRAPGPPEVCLPPGSQWILVPLGNPGDEYAATRHNLGRLLLQRWMDVHCREAGPREAGPRGAGPRGAGPGKPGRVHAFKTGSLYALGEPFLALVPATYMNLSGQVCAEAAAAGFDPKRMILLHDDKDLPLGLGRFRLTGSSAGHNGMASVFERLGTADVARLRLGIGPYQRPLHDFVLGEWTEEEWRLIDALDAPFARFLEVLAAAESLEALPGLINAEAFWRAIPLESEGLS